MTGELKVYRWLSWRTGKGQVYRMVAVPSVAAAMRASGDSRRQITMYGGETGNPRDVAVAMAEPGVMFYEQVLGRGQAPIEREDAR